MWLRTHPVSSAHITVGPSTCNATERSRLSTTPATPASRSYFIPSILPIQTNHNGDFQMFTPVHRPPTKRIYSSSSPLLSSQLALFFFFVVQVPVSYNFHTQHQQLRARYSVPTLTSPAPLSRWPTTMANRLVR